MINNVVLSGRLTRDVELRKTANGTSVVSFNLAVDRGIKKEGQPDADFISCQAWSKTAELMETHLHKGSLIGMEGHIQTGSYKNNQGQTVYTTNVIVDRLHFLEPKNSTQGQIYKNPYKNTQQTQTSNSVYLNEVKDDTLDISSDDLPF